jgi:hypothetical protein
VKRLHIRDRHLKRTKLRDRNAKGITGGQEGTPDCGSLIGNTKNVAVISEGLIEIDRVRSLNSTCLKVLSSEI